MRAESLIVLTALLLTACGGAADLPDPTPERTLYRYSATAAMSSEYVASEDGNISVLLPDGWVQTSDPAEAPSILLWLVQDDYNASLSFTELRMDPALYETLKRDGLEAVARVSLSLKQRGASGELHLVQKPEMFRIGGRMHVAYEYRSAAAEAIIRVVVFDTGSRFMECVIFPASHTITPAANRRLFEVQQSVLASMVCR
jgi:hypothetical protein